MNSNPQHGNPAACPQKVLDLLASIEDGLNFIKIIGAGSLGTVYKCTDSRGATVAVKIMEKTPLVDDDIFEDIISAAIKTSPVASECPVVKVLSAGKCPPFYYVIMEFFEGGTLEVILDNPSVPFKQKLSLGASIADAIASIHARGIIHNDLKPSNILLDKKNKPFLNDFYLFSARPAKPFKGMPQGTPYYMSPEQTSGQMPSVLNDVFSFGVLFYELLTGLMPYENDPKNIAEMIQTVSGGKIIPPRSRNKSISRKLNSVILKLLERNPENRYRDMAVVAADIHACILNKEISIPEGGNPFISLFSLFRRE